MENNVAEGYGIFYYKDGYIYEGEFKNGSQEGYGILYNENNKIIFKGQYKGNLREWYGIEYFTDGQEMKLGLKMIKKKDME